MISSTTAKFAKVLISSKAFCLRRRVLTYIYALLQNKALWQHPMWPRNGILLRQNGAEFVKAEGGRDILPQVRAILAEGIPFLGHIGMLPQHILEEGGKYRIKGRDDAGRAKLLDDASALAEAGAFAVVLEIVTPPVAREITEKFPFVTIGIGSGPDCDGQILVTPDLIGAFPWFTPKFVKPKMNAAEQMRAAIAEWRQSI